MTYITRNIWYLQLFPYIPCYTLWFLAVVEHKMTLFTFLRWKRSKPGGNCTNLLLKTHKNVDFMTTLGPPVFFFLPANI